MEKINKYGFVKPTITSDNYTSPVLGGFGGLPKIFYQGDGQWDAFLPKYEAQFNSFYDTYGCTVWGTQNAIEILEKRIWGGGNINYSERFTYILAGVRPPGADPHKIAEVVRKSGLIDNSQLPFTETYEEFLKPDPMTENFLDKGQEWLDKFYFGHEWVSPQEIKELLVYSPIAVSVTAWFLKDGVYVDNGLPNNHWCVIFGYTDKGWKVFDSYDHSVKILSFNHKIEYAKRYYLTNRSTEKLGLIDRIIYYIGKALKIVQKEVETITETNVTPPETPEIAYSEVFIKEVENSLGTDVSPQNKAPQELSCAEGVSELIRKVFPDFPVLTWTPDLFNQLKKDRRFKATLDPKGGCVIVSPTKSTTQRGHAGVFITDTDIASNDSRTGTFNKNYTWSSWISTFKSTRGLNIYLFEMV